MESKERIDSLQSAIREQYGCDSNHVESAPLQKTLGGQIAWRGIVEVFALVNHPQAKRCYAWVQPRGDDKSHERAVVMLHIPPIDSPTAAVDADILKESKRLHFAKSVWTKEQLDRKTVEFRCHSLDYGSVEGIGEFVVYQRPDGAIAVCIDVNQEGRTWAERTVTRFYLPKLAVDAIKQNPAGSQFAYSCNARS